MVVRQLDSVLVRVRVELTNETRPYQTAAPGWYKQFLGNGRVGYASTEVKPSEAFSPHQETQEGEVTW
jgi:hypothetical protein